MATPGLYEHLKCYELVFWISLLLQLYQITRVPIGLTVSGWICPFVHMDLLPFGEIQQLTPWEVSCFAVVEQKSVAINFYTPTNGQLDQTHQTVKFERWKQQWSTFS